MADFGEYLPYDAVLFDTEIPPEEYHNFYPEAWAQLNEEAVKEYEAEFRSSNKTALEGGLEASTLWGKTVAGLKELRHKTVHLAAFGKEASESSEECLEEREIFFFMRSAWLRSPQYSRAFWIGSNAIMKFTVFHRPFNKAVSLGDQMVSWDGYDGIKSVLIAYLSGGIGGHSLTHSDIGGYTVVCLLLSSFLLRLPIKLILRLISKRRVCFPTFGQKSFFFAGPSWKLSGRHCFALT